MSLSKQKETKRRAKNKRTNSEAIDKMLMKSKFKKKGLKKMNTKFLFSEVFTDLKNKQSKLHTNSNMKPSKQKKSSKRETHKMFNTMGTNKINPRKKNLMLSKKEMTKLFLNRKQAEDLILEGKNGNHVRFENRKKSIKIFEELQGIRESLVESGFTHPELRFKSTKKKLGKADFELNMKRHSNNGCLSKRKLGASPETRSRKNIHRDFNVKMRKISKEKDFKPKRKTHVVTRVELDLGNEVRSRSKMLDSGKNVINSVKIEKQLIFDENSKLYDRKSMNTRSQKSVFKRKQEIVKCRAGGVKSKDKQYRRRTSEKNILLAKENVSMNKQRKKKGLAKSSALTSKHKKRNKEHFEYVQLFREAQQKKESSRSKKSKRKQTLTLNTNHDNILRSDAWGVSKKKQTRTSKQKETDKKPSAQIKRNRKDREMLKKLGDSKFHSLFKSQRKAHLLKLMESATEKTLHSGINRKNSNKLLGNLNFNILSKRKSAKTKNLKSLSKIFRNGILKTKKDSHNFLFDTKSKSLKKKHDFYMK
jgi:hypothetical protein